MKGLCSFHGGPFDGKRIKSEILQVLRFQDHKPQSALFFGDFTGPYECIEITEHRYELHTLRFITKTDQYEIFKYNYMNPVAVNVRIIG